MECFVRPLLRKAQSDIPEPEALIALSKDEGGMEDCQLFEYPFLAIIISHLAFVPPCSRQAIPPSASHRKPLSSTSWPSWAKSSCSTMALTSSTSFQRSRLL